MSLAGLLLAHADLQRRAGQATVGAIPIPIDHCVEHATKVDRNRIESYTEHIVYFAVRIECNRREHEIIRMQHKRVYISHIYVKSSHTNLMNLRLMSSRSRVMSPGKMHTHC